MRTVQGMVLVHKSHPQRNAELHGVTVRVVSTDGALCTWEVVSRPDGSSSAYWRPGQTWTESVVNMGQYFIPVTESLFRRKAPLR